ncbi:MAG TPA: TonB family protein [Thermodesulfobacteriota bacterium]|nr:TonB family protein [Thermodesulfobacteriota bacterium]
MSDKKIVLGLIAVVIVLLGGGVYLVKIFLSSANENSRTKSGIVIVNLPKAPPIAEKEKPPEPIKEIQRKVEVTTPEKDEMMDAGPNIGPQNITDNALAGDKPGLAGEAPGSNDNTPAGDTLGLDAEGRAGSDAFGLVARKGGRSILAGGGSGKGGGDGSGRVGGGGSGKIGGGGPRGSLLDKFGWYTQIVKNEISKTVQKRLEENGGIPRGKLQTVVRVSVDGTGAVTQCGIVGSSGNHELDESVKRFIGNIKISEPPPDGMPRTMVIRVTSQG